MRASRNNNEERPLQYAGNGLAMIRQFYLKAPQVPIVARVPPKLQQLFMQGKQLTVDEQITARHNIARLLEWVIEDVNDLNGEVLEVDPSELNLALTVLKMMQMAQLARGRKAVEVAMIGGEAAHAFDNMLRDATKNCQDLSKKIRDDVCRLVSDGCRKSKQSLLARRNDILRDPHVLLSGFVEIELNSLFPNVLMNLRRLLRHVAAENPEKCRNYTRALNLLELKLYYLSMAALPKPEAYVRRLYDDIFHEDRKSTFVYLLHDERGLLKLHRYFEEAPLEQLENDMKLISNQYYSEMNPK